MTDIEKLKDNLYHARILQREVAEAAGVTPAMVSLVFTQRAKSSKVIKAAQDLLSERLKKGVIRYIC